MAATARLTRAERSAQTRGELLDAAQRRFFEAGYHATALGDVAEDAGYTKGAVYSTFGSKAGLFLALFDEIVDRRLAAARAIIEPDSGSELLDAFAERCRRLRNGFALERLIDPDRVPGYLMANVQARLLATRR